MRVQADTLALRRPAATTRELSRWAALNLTRLPFESELSLEPLLAFYREAAAQPGMAGVRLLAREIDAALRAAPVLAGPVSDPAALAGHREALDLLMTSVFPPALRDREMAAALVPFEFRPFYFTPAFGRYLLQDDGALNGQINLDLGTYTYGRIVSAYLHILRTIYGVEVPFDYPVVFTVADPDTGLDRHFDITTDLRFVRVEPVGSVPPLDAGRQKELLDRLSDLAFWKELFPPDGFRFSGFSIVHADDVTEHRTLALLESDLSDGERILSGQVFPLMAERLRALLRVPRFDVGLATVDGQHLLVLGEPVALLARGLRRPSGRYALDELEGSVFRRCLDERVMVLVDDLAASADGGAVEARMREAGVRNLVLAPLVAGREAVGVLFLWSREPGTLHALNVIRLQEALPHFAKAVRRGLEALHNRVRNVIMGAYTAIHPTIEWRFRQAALNYIQRQEHGQPAEVEPVVFHDVYPLFAAADIRASSAHRNEAVRLDLLGHLALAREVLQVAWRTYPLPILHHLLARIDRHAAALRRGIASGDETAVRTFLRQDVDPILGHLRQLQPELRRRIEHYETLSDPAAGTLYARSRAFEESVAAINRTITDYLDEQEARMQAAIPHYFEKHQTDGVAFSIYAGASLLEHGGFEPVHVRALRLWQLLLVCGIARRVGPLNDRLAVPLETTHLVLVQHTPVTIRFRFDESRFDVDGAQHIRYEIMKQRVEKATLRDSDERVTQPGQVAVVFAQDREGQEYAGYLGLLDRWGLLGGPVEESVLADLQGVTGLRALRVHLAPDAPAERTETDPEAILRAVRALPA